MSHMKNERKYCSVCKIMWTIFIYAGYIAYKMSISKRELFISFNIIYWMSNKYFFSTLKNIINDGLQLVVEL